MMAHLRFDFLSFRALIIFGLLAGVLGLVEHSEAQAGYTATKNLSFSTFAGVSSFTSDWGRDYKKQNLNFMVGQDITREFGSFGVSLEPRFGHISNDLTRQTYLLGNLKVERSVGRGHWLHPYVAAGLGYGKFYEGTDKDNSPVYAGGGGADIGVTTHIALKAEYEYQFWDLGSPHSKFNPAGYTAAVVYRFGGGSYPGSR